MLDLDTFADFVRARLKESGETPAAAALRAGLPRDAIRSVLRGHPPSLPRAAEICEALGVEIAIRPPRPAGGRKSSIPEWVNDFRSDLRAGLRLDLSRLLKGQRDKIVTDVAKEIGAEVRNEEPNAADWTVVPSVTAAHEGQSPSSIAFPKDRVMELGFTDPCLVMGHLLTEPEFSDATAVVVDRARRQLADDRIYLLRWQNNLVVRRARLEDGQWLAAEESERNPWPVDAEIIGEVRFVTYPVHAVAPRV